MKYPEKSPARRHGEAHRRGVFRSGLVAVR